MDLGKVGASFLGSLILGLMSHTMSRRYKRPVIIFIVPGIIPLVPGGAAYEATRYLVSNDYTNAVNTFLEVTLISEPSPLVFLSQKSSTTSTHVSNSIMVKSKVKLIRNLII